MAYSLRFGPVSLALGVALLLHSASVSAQRLVYFGNEQTGERILIQDQPDAMNKALAKIRTKKGPFKLLLATDDVGFGNNRCVSTFSRGGRFWFHVAHGFPTSDEAYKAANEMAQPRAAETETTRFGCGAWEVKPLAPGTVSPAKKLTGSSTITGEKFEADCLAPDPRPAEWKAASWCPALPDYAKDCAIPEPIPSGWSLPNYCPGQRKGDPGSNVAPASVKLPVQ